MKKLLYLIVIVLILGLALTGCSLLSNVGQVPTTEQSGIAYLTKGTPGDPDVFTLYAGQNIDVGIVEVWNDTDNLYVNYVVDDPWRLTETHFHVAADLDGIPQTKKGNPIPGQFDYEGEHNCEQYFLYTIPLAGLNVELYIAAHAVVADTSSEMKEVVVSRPDIDVYGPLGVYADLGDLSWGLANPAVATWVHPNWILKISIPGATWISTAEYVEDPVNNSWRWFHDEITLPEKGYYIAGSVVLATADNAEEVYFNEESVGSNGNWTVPTEYSIEPQPGLNTLDFIVRNYAQAGGSAASNPTGLIYKVTVTYYPEESAWAVNGEGPDFIGSLPLPGENWATYFKYNLEEIFIETVTVVSDGASYSSSEILETGKTYRLDASGTYKYWPAQLPDAGIADAKYSLRPDGYCNNTGSAAWISGDDLFICYGVRYLELLLDGLPQPWGTFNKTHTYSIEYIGTGNTVCFKIPDTGYGDNSGSLLVDIIWIP